MLAQDDFIPRRTARERRIEAALIIAFWTFMALLTATGRILDPRGGELTDAAAAGQFGRSFLTFYSWALLTPLVFYLGHRFSIDRDTWARRVPLHLGVALLLAFAMDMLADAIRVLIPVPYGPPARFDPIGHLKRFWFLNELILYIAVLAAAIARDYFYRYRARLAESARLHAQLAEARLETLRSQLNPHFLFNTLNAVSTLVEDDPRGVRRMIARLSALLRYTLDDKGPQEVPLQQELGFLRDYLEIQQIRFQGRLEVREEIAPETLTALVPSLILQPLVENAIKHGVGQLEGVGRIVLRAERIRARLPDRHGAAGGARLRLTVADNGPGLQAPASEGDGHAALEAEPGAVGGFGLRYTRERLEALYGETQALTFTEGPEGGFAVVLTLPLRTAQPEAVVPRPAFESGR